jgi:Tfp pilus assembly protein PilO
MIRATSRERHHLQDIERRLDALERRISALEELRTMLQSLNAPSHDEVMQEA